MFLVSETPYTKRLKIVLQSNIFYILCFIIIAIWCLTNYTVLQKDSIYNQDNTQFTMTITDYNFDGNKLSLDLKGQENLVGTYYISTKEELNNLQEQIKYGVEVELEG